MTLKKRSDGDTGEKELPVEKPESRKKSEQSVIVYITILFSVVFLLILLSYFMHQRENETTISNLQGEHIEYQQEILKIEDENKKLKEKLDKSEKNAEELKKEKSELSESLKNAEKTVDELKKENEELDREKSELEEKLSAAEAEIESLKEALNENGEEVENQ